MFKNYHVGDPLKRAEKGYKLIKEDMGFVQFDLDTFDVRSCHSCAIGQSYPSIKFYTVLKFFFGDDNDQESFDHGFSYYDERDGEELQEAWLTIIKENQ